jgi:hypothetical protein
MFMLTARPSPGSINTGFGPRTGPRPTSSSPAIHYGQDYGWGNGDTILAAADGVVVEVAMAGAYGRRTRIRHEDGYETWYCHQAQALVKVGDHVKAGQPIGVQGATGNVTAKHLHFEVRDPQGVARDPEIYFRRYTDTLQEENMTDLGKIQEALNVLGATGEDLQHVEANGVKLTTDDLLSRVYIMQVAGARSLARVEKRLTNVDNRVRAIAAVTANYAEPPEAGDVPSAER